MFCAAAWTFPFLNIMIKGYGYGQKKGNSDHDKGGGIIPCRPGGSKSDFPLWSDCRGQEAATGRRREAAFHKRLHRPLLVKLGFFTMTETI